MPRDTFDSFEVDHELAEHEGAQSIVRFCFKIGGQAIGDNSSESPVALVAVEVAAMLRHEGHRNSQRYATTSAPAVVAELNARLLVDFDPGIELTGNHDNPLRFLALPQSLPAFEAWSAFLIEDNTAARFIWCLNTRQPTVHEHHLAPGAFGAALQAFLAALVEAGERTSTIPASGTKQLHSARQVG